MKRIISLLAALVLAGVLFAGCAPATMKDGTYKAEYSAPDDHGWAEYLVVTVKDGKITEVEYDALNADGMKKTDDPEYKASMENAGFSTWPTDFFPKYESQLVEKQDAEKIDAITGATHAYNTMKALYKELRKNIEKGDTTTVKVTPLVQED